MSKKDIYLADVKNGSEIKTSFMVMRVMFKDTSKIVCILADKSGEIKATIPTKKSDIEQGVVLEIEGKKDVNLEVKKYCILNEYNAIDYLPTVKRPIKSRMFLDNSFKFIALHFYLFIVPKYSHILVLQYYDR